jgi:hypothetical protein
MLDLALFINDKCRPHTVTAGLVKEAVLFGGRPFPIA